MWVLKGLQKHRYWRLGLLGIFASLGFVLVLMAFAIAAVQYFARTELGSQRLARILNASLLGTVKIEQVRGEFGKAFRIAYLEVHLPHQTLKINNLYVTWQPHDLWQRHLAVQVLHADKVFLQTQDDGTPLKLPRTLKLPWGLKADLQDIYVGYLSKTTLLPAKTSSILSFTKTKKEKNKPSPNLSTPVVLEKIRGSLKVDRTYQVNIQALTHLGTSVVGLNLRGDLATQTPFNLNGKGELDVNLTQPLAQSMQIKWQVQGTLSDFVLSIVGSGQKQQSIDNTVVAKQVHAEKNGPKPNVSEKAAVDITGHVRLHPYAVFPIADMALNLSRLNPAHWNQAWPDANLHLELALAPKLATSKVRPSLNNALSVPPLSGSLRLNNQTPKPFNQHGIAVTELSADLAWVPQSEKAGLFTADHIFVQLLGAHRATEKATLSSKQKYARSQVRGDIRLPFDLAKKSSNSEFDARFEIKNIDPQQLVTSLQSADINGQIKLKGDVKRGVAINSEMNVQTQLVQRNHSFSLQLEGKVDEQKAQLKRLIMLAETMSVNLDGEWKWRETGAYNLQGNFAHFNPALLFVASPPADISAQFSVQGQRAPTLTAKFKLDLAPSSIREIPFTGGGRFNLDERGVYDTDLELHALENHLSIRGGFGKREDRLILKLNAPYLARLGFGLAGQANANLNLNGTLSHPTGNFDADFRQIKLGSSAKAISLETARAHLLLGPQAKDPLQGDLSISELNFGEPGPYKPTVRSVRMRVDGTRAVHSGELSLQLDDFLVPRVTGGREIVTNQSAHIAFAGGLDEAWAWQGNVYDVHGEGRFNFQQENLQQRVAVNVSAQEASLARMVLVAKRARLALERTYWSPQRMAFVGKVSGLRVGVSLDEFQRPVLAGKTLQIGGEWDLVLAEKANGFVRFEREAGDIVVQGDAPVAMGLQQTLLTLSAVNGRLAFAFSAAGSRMGNISASATALTRRVGSGFELVDDAPLVGSATIQTPSVAWLGPLLSQDLQTGGSVSGEFSLSGTPAAPNSSGRIIGQDLFFGLADEGLRLSGGHMELAFDRDRVKIEQLDFVSPNRITPQEKRIDVRGLTQEPGRLSATGEWLLDNNEGNLSFKADRLPLLQRQDQWMMISGQGQIVSRSGQAEVNARLRADAAYFGLGQQVKPSLSEDVHVVGAQKKPARKLALSANVDFQLGDAVYLKLAGLDARLNGSLRFTQLPQQPLQVYGTVRSEEGVYDAYGQKLTITSGAINFQGTLNNPGLNVIALRTGLAVEAGVEVTGSVQQPKVRLISDPPVPDTEKLSWIVLGRPPDASGNSDAALLVSAATAVLGGSGESLTHKIARNFGLDDISVNQSEGGSRPLSSQVANGSGATTTAGGVEGQVVSLSKRLSNQAYLSFEQSLIGAESFVKLTYILSRQFSLVARAGTENALDFLYSLSFE